MGRRAAGLSEVREAPRRLAWPLSLPQWPVPWVVFTRQTSVSSGQRLCRAGRPPTRLPGREMPAMRWCDDGPSEGNVGTARGTHWLGVTLSPGAGQ